MGRRGVKEYRASEALELILADRDRLNLSCPSCGHARFDRTPKRRSRVTPVDPNRQVVLKCCKCGRQASYVPRNVTQRSLSEMSL